MRSNFVGYALAGRLCARGTARYLQDVSARRFSRLPALATKSYRRPLPRVAKSPSSDWFVNFKLGDAGSERLLTTHCGH